jgi:hypothetical protein
MTPAAFESVGTEYVGVYIRDRWFSGLICRGLQTTVVSASLAHLVEVQPRRSIALQTTSVECLVEISLNGPATTADTMVVDLAPLQAVDVLIGADLLPH